MCIIANSLKLIFYFCNQFQPNENNNKPQILNLQQTFKFPSSFLKKQPIKENCTQTSKTLIEIVQNEEISLHNSRIFVF